MNPEYKRFLLEENERILLEENERILLLEENISEVESIAVDDIAPFIQFISFVFLVLFLVREYKIFVAKF
jgi:hypothetical protein